MKKAAIYLPIVAIFITSSIASDSFLSISYLIKNIIVGVLLLVAIFCIWYNTKTNKNNN